MLLRPAVALPVETYAMERLDEFRDGEKELESWYENNGWTVRAYLDANVLFLAAADRRAHLESFRKALEVHDHFAGTGKEPLELPLPAKDLPVLASALSLECEALLTRDRTHFGTLYGRSVAGVTILSPRGPAEMLLKRRRQKPDANA
ncbi:MAG: hypothetical protein ACOCW6_07965 [Spirochaetota bacterium]